MIKKNDRWWRTGCQHNCSYCYARLFMPRYSGHQEPWGEFVDVKINALHTIRDAGIRTFAFIGPLLPGNPENLIDNLAGKVDYVYIDRMNYTGSIQSFYRRLGWEKALKDSFFRQYRDRLVSALEQKGIDHRALF